MKLSYLKYVCLLLLFFLISCTTTDDIVQERFEKAKTGTGDIVIGIIWPESKLKSDFKNGIDLALEEVNEDGLIDSRQMRIIFRDNKGDKKRNRAIVRSFAQNTEMIAVMGHFYSSFALPSSVTYQENGLLFLTPGSLLFELSMHGFEMFFRSIPNTIAVGTKCGLYTYKLGFNKPIVLWERSTYGKSMFHIYKERLAKLGINIAHSFSYFSLEEGYRDILAQMKNLDFDVIFMAVSSSDAPFFIRQAREHGIDTPIFGINLVEEVLNERVGEIAGNIYTISNFDSDSDFPPTVEFVKKFKEKYDRIPDVWGAYGYDGIKLLAYLIKTYETTHPELLASNLRYLENWPGATGMHTFTPRGEVRTKPLYLEQFIDNKFVQIAVDTLKVMDIFRVYNNVLRTEIEKGFLKIYKTGDITTVLLPDVSIFTGTKFEISKSGDRLLGILIGELLKQPDYFIDIEGFADIQFVTDRTKSKSDILLDLSLDKSAQVAKKLYELGYIKSKIQVIGRGYSGRSRYVTEIGGRKIFNNRVELILKPISRQREL